MFIYYGTLNMACVLWISCCFKIILDRYTALGIMMADLVLV